MRISNKFSNYTCAVYAFHVALKAEMVFVWKPNLVLPFVGLIASFVALIFTSLLSVQWKLKKYALIVHTAEETRVSTGDETKNGDCKHVTGIARVHIQLLQTEDMQKLITRGRAFSPAWMNDAVQFGHFQKNVKLNWLFYHLTLKTGCKANKTFSGVQNAGFTGVQVLNSQYFYAQVHHKKQQTLSLYKNS